MNMTISIGRPLQNSNCKVKTQVEIPHLLDALSWMKTPMSTLLYCKLKEFTSDAKRNHEVYRKKKKRGAGGGLMLNYSIWNIVTYHTLKVEHCKTKPLTSQLTFPSHNCLNPPDPKPICHCSNWKSIYSRVPPIYTNYTIIRCVTNCTFHNHITNL